MLIDGLGDVSLPRFGYKTPLQAADVPNLDAIASAGVNGLLDPVEVGLGCGSDTAHLSLLGYNPRVYYRGRGAFESMGAGLAMSPGDIAFKVGLFSCFIFFYNLIAVIDLTWLISNQHLLVVSFDLNIWLMCFRLVVTCHDQLPMFDLQSNFATLDEKTGIVTSRRADRHFEEEGPILCAALDRMKLPSFPQYEVRVRCSVSSSLNIYIMLSCFLLNSIKCKM